MHRMRRRSFLLGSAGLALAPLLAPLRRAFAETASGAALPTALLEKSGFVYISPLRPDGRETTCHGEVWYGWIDGAVVVITALDSWKSRAQASGFDRARVWVGDHGRWKRLVGRNEAFREAPHFDARVAPVVGDAALLERLLAIYETKYPDEIGAWRDKMRSGYQSGERVLLRYTPLAV